MIENQATSIFLFSLSPFDNQIGLKSVDELTSLPDRWDDKTEDDNDDEGGEGDFEPSSMTESATGTRSSRSLSLFAIAMECDYSSLAISDRFLIRYWAQYF